MGDFQNIIGPVIPTDPAIKRAKARADYDSFLEAMGGEEEEVTKAFEKMSADMKDQWSDLYGSNDYKRINDLIKKRDALPHLKIFTDTTEGKLEFAKRRQARESVDREIDFEITNVLKERYFGKAANLETGANEINPYADNSFLGKALKSMFKESDFTAGKMWENQRYVREQDYKQEEYEHNNKSGSKGAWIRDLGNFIDVGGKIAIAAATFIASGGAFTWIDGSSDPSFDPDFDDIGPDTGGSGWGEDFGKDGEGFYYDPSNGEFGESDNDTVIDPGEQIPDYTRPDPVRPDTTEDGSLPISSYPSYSPSVSTGSFGEYGYSKFQQEGETESKLGNFGSTGNIKKTKDVATGASTISQWVKNMPLMPKAASFLYPQ